MNNEVDPRMKSAIKDDSRVVVAYVMLMFVILFGIGIGWVGHMILTSATTQRICNGQGN